jgi:hypothetical protein
VNHRRKRQRIFTEGNEGNEGLAHRDFLGSQVVIRSLFRNNHKGDNVNEEF